MNIYIQWTLSKTDTLYKADTDTGNGWFPSEFFQLSLKADDYQADILFYKGDTFFGTKLFFL